MGKTSKIIKKNESLDGQERIIPFVKIVPAYFKTLFTHAAWS